MLIAPYLMTIFDTITIYNTKLLRGHPIGTARYRRADIQIPVMLLL